MDFINTSRRTSEIQVPSELTPRKQGTTFSLSIQERLAWPLTRIGCTVGFKLLSTNVTLANTPWSHAHPTNTIWLQMVLAAGSMLWKHWTFWKPGKANPNYNLMGEKKGFMGSRSQRVNCDPQVPRPCPPNITSQNRQGE